MLKGKQRQRETAKERQIRLKVNAKRNAERRQRETANERESRLEANAEREADRRQRETREQHNIRVQAERKYCALNVTQWNMSVYNSDYTYESESIVSIRSLSSIL
ncbi:hypothetical protein AVEN_203625-1 [Araneus ventricosus]|uniref:Uncharacterized protein n=1 Tax=Araneus ventricosus TaxID=182803 RepID=A0A4Y2TNE2_ARAVE|nr:hypothetical protein AVEN_134463-1 [Araneus ventricosus]GBO02158.1 hypothetical protein AVEN_203625-1 [Araneus ventricosus]